jgi:Zn-dependent peptidase ImmA (M78 family)
VGPGPEFATLEAERLAMEHSFDALPIDPRALAEKVGIPVFEKPASPGVSGMLIRSGNTFAIAYATHVSNEGFRRFSIAHELGHYFLPGHVDRILASDGTHESRAGFTARDNHEREADNFAAGLLMPRKLFVRAQRQAGEGLQAIEQLASTCLTSLSATAIRFAEFVDIPLAVVLSKQEQIEYCCMSRQFKALRLAWLKRGDPVPRKTLTYRFNGDPSRILQAERTDGSARLDSWFNNAPDLGAYEEVIGLGRYGRTLTVLTVQDVPDDEEAEEDRALIASWTPTFSRSRRR